MWMYYLLFIFVTLHSVTSGVVTSCSANGPKDPTKELEVSIIVSPVAIDNVPRHLILSWENASPNDGDWIGLFNKEPTNASIGVPLYVIKPQKSAGWELTGSSETEIIDDLGYTKKCLGFWTAYVSAGNTSILASSCLQTEPTWMSDMRTVLSPLKLRQIFLPGTHDSGSYAEYDPSTANNLVIKYTITQEEDILNQLIYGVRYLDIRVGYYGTDETMWWVNHGVMRLHPFQQVLDDVKTFLESTNEIVIMDFHEFPVGFETGLEIHKKLVQLLEQELEEHAVPASLSWEATLGEIWSANKRLIVSYDKADMIGQSSILWSAVSQQWGNVQTLNDLYNNMLLYTLTLAVLVVGALGCVQLPRIFGGDPTTIDKHPYQVSLEREYKGEFYHNCGGSIINEDWVLTAAHCVRDRSSEELKVRVGSTYVNERREGDVHTVSHFIVHPEHDPYLRMYDVAVVKVAEPFKLSDNVQPISMVSETPANGSPVVVTGWGRTENNFQPPKQLMQVGLGIMDIDACNQTYSGYVFDSMVCANVPGEPKSGCMGDSGGPLVYDGKVAGVVSWGSGNCGYFAEPSVFANVALVKDWVSSTTGVN